MNIYLGDAGIMQVCVEYIDIWPRYEEERVFNLIVAKSRGKARALFTNHHDLEFIDSDVSIRKVMTGVAIDEQFSYRECSYRTKDYDKMLKPYEDECWAVICRDDLMGDNKESTDCTDPTDCPYIELCRQKNKCKYEAPAY
jgi:hypothetical protein